MHTSSFLRSSLCLLLLAGLAGTAIGCKPKAVRGGPGTENPNLDSGAMSTTLDRVDIDYLVNENLNAMFASGWWARDVQGSMANPPIVAIWPIKNATSMHLDDQMLTLLSQIEELELLFGGLEVGRALIPGLHRVQDRRALEHGEGGLALPLRRQLDRILDLDEAVDLRQAVLVLASGDVLAHRLGLVRVRRARGQTQGEGQARDGSKFAACAHGDRTRSRELSVRSPCCARR